MGLFCFLLFFLPSVSLLGIPLAPTVPTEFKTFPFSFAADRKKREKRQTPPSFPPLSLKTHGLLSSPPPSPSRQRCPLFICPQPKGRGEGGGAAGRIKLFEGSLEGTKQFLFSWSHFCVSVNIAYKGATKTSTMFLSWAYS